MGFGLVCPKYLSLLTNSLWVFLLICSNVWKHTLSVSGCIISTHQLHRIHAWENTHPRVNAHTRIHVNKQIHDCRFLFVNFDFTGFCRFGEDFHFGVGISVHKQYRELGTIFNYIIYLYFGPRAEIST